MNLVSKYTKFIPYFYFIAVIAYWFTTINRSEGFSAYPILLFGIPFLWQIIKPNKTLNLTLGITFMCLSSYMIVAFLTDMLDITSFIKVTQSFVFYVGIFVMSNFVMALWIIRNSLRRSF